MSQILVIVKSEAFFIFLYGLFEGRGNHIYLDTFDTITRS